MLQIITHNSDPEDYAPELVQIRQALEGGCRWIQLRKKGAAKDVVRNAVREALAVVRQYAGAKLIVDDYADIALETGADGVHLGKNDMPVREARQLARNYFRTGIQKSPETGDSREMPGLSHANGLAGPADEGAFIIGATANTLDDIVNAASEGADYIGLGPLRFTTTKSNLSPVLGYEGYRSILESMRREDINLPVVAIGSVTTADIEPLKQSGVGGVAVSGAIIGAADPVKAAAEFVRLAGA